MMKTVFDNRQCNGSGRQQTCSNCGVYFDRTTRSQSVRNYILNVVRKQWNMLDLYTRFYLSSLSQFLVPGLDKDKVRLILLFLYFLYKAAQTLFLHYI
jgi:hypothetical protein